MGSDRLIFISQGPDGNRRHADLLRFSVRRDFMSYVYIRMYMCARVVNQYSAFRSARAYFVADVYDRKNRRIIATIGSAYILVTFAFRSEFFSPCAKTRIRA